MEMTSWSPTENRQKSPNRRIAIEKCQPRNIQPKDRQLIENEPMDRQKTPTENTVSSQPFLT